mmetsp:Transcript_46005/g.91167  ORF Transcript_46005/g.91167 Transcript_46005/m.91167 type:complete len:437 (+) Transcript_46005:3-1313(+)
MRKHGARPAASEALAWLPGRQSLLDVVPELQARHLEEAQHDHHDYHDRDALLLLSVFEAVQLYHGRPLRRILRHPDEYGLDGVADGRDLEDPPQIRRCRVLRNHEAREHHENGVEWDGAHLRNLEVWSKRRHHREEGVEDEEIQQRPLHDHGEVVPVQAGEHVHDDTIQHSADQRQGDVHTNADDDEGLHAVEALGGVVLHDGPVLDQLRHQLHAAHADAHQQHEDEGDLLLQSLAADVGVHDSEQDAREDRHQYGHEDRRRVPQGQRQLALEQDAELRAEGHREALLAEGARAHPRGRLLLMLGLQQVLDGRALLLPLLRDDVADAGQLPVTERSDEEVNLLDRPAGRNQVQEEIRRVGELRHGVAAALPIGDGLGHRAVVDATAGVRRQQQQLVEELRYLHPRLMDHDQSQDAELLGDDAHGLDASLGVRGGQA